MSRKANQSQWTVPLLKQAFELFHLENGHYPSAVEIDDCPYLCTSRFIQLRFGGLVNLRGMIGVAETNLTKGKSRKAIALRINEYSLISEKEIGTILRKYFGEIFVHEEKKYGSGRNRVDFFVYASETFAAEVFNTYTLRGIAGNLNLKLRKFNEFPYKLIFVVTGGSFNQEEIDRLLIRKNNALSSNMQCISAAQFENHVRMFKPHPLFK